MFAKHNAEITGIAKVSQNEVFGARWIAELVMMGGSWRTSIVNAAMKKAVDREYIV